MAGGTLLSAFWILSANSWMQTPAGHVLDADGRFVPESWWAVIFNPSFPYRFAHTVTAAYLTTAMIVGAVGAWHLLRDRFNPRARLMFSMAMWMAAFVAPVQLVLGDLHGGNTYHHQPAKVAAMEGHFESERRAPRSCSAGPMPRVDRPSGRSGSPVSPASTSPTTSMPR